MPRSLGRHQIGFSQRTGRKVRARDLVEDGEHRGLIVDRREADKEHPQKFAKAIPADRPSLLPSIPENRTEAVTIRFGYETSVDALYAGRMAMPALGVVMGNWRLTVTQDSVPAWAPIADGVEPGIAINFDTGEIFISWDSGA